MVAQGIATPLVAAGYLLAKCTHAPDLLFTSAIGQGLCRDWAPLGLARVEGLWLERAITVFGFGRVVTEVLPRYHLKEFFRPGQVDAAGNFNNISIGRDYRRPRLRLPGSGGIPDVTPVTTLAYLYVPRHSRATFVAELDFCSGLAAAGRLISLPIWANSILRMDSYALPVCILAWMWNVCGPRPDLKCSLLPD